MHAQTVDTRPLFPPPTWSGYAAKDRMEESEKPAVSLVVVRRSDIVCQLSAGSSLTLLIHDTSGSVVFYC